MKIYCDCIKYELDIKKFTLFVGDNGLKKTRAMNEIYEKQKNTFILYRNPERDLYDLSIIKRCDKIVNEINNTIKRYSIIETNSETFFNQLRVNGIYGNIKHDDCIVYYFSKNEDDERPNVEVIYFNDKFNPSNWLTGFFDTKLSQLTKLCGFE